MRVFNSQVFFLAQCSPKQTAQKVYEWLRDDFGYFTIKSQIRDYIKQTKDNPPQCIATNTFGCHYIIIKRGTIGHIMRGMDGMHIGMDFYGYWVY